MCIIYHFVLSEQVYNMLLIVLNVWIMTRKNWRGGEKKVLQKLKVDIGIPVQAVNFDKAQEKMKLQ